MPTREEIMGNAMALGIDAQIWWLGVENHCRKYVTCLAKETLLDLKPRWYPSFLWKKIIEKLELR